MANVLAGTWQNLLWLEELLFAHNNFYFFLTCDIQPIVTLSVKRFTKIKIYYIITAWKCEM